MAKFIQKIKAKNLRKSGKSIKEIAKELNISVGSVSNWCSDIVLSNDQIKKLQLRRTDPYYGKKAEYLFKKKNQLKDKIEKIKKTAFKELGSLDERDIFLIGIALYWGEGFKKDSQVGFATSDANMARFFIIWLERCFHIKKENLIFRVTANISYKSKIKNLEKYWSEKLQIGLGYFSKAFFQRTKWKKVYENKDMYHGVIRIKVRKSKDLLRKFIFYIQAVAELN